MIMDEQEIKKRLNRISSYKNYRLSNLDRVAITISFSFIRAMEQDFPNLYYKIFNKLMHTADKK